MIQCMTSYRYDFKARLSFQRNELMQCLTDTTQRQAKAVTYRTAFHCGHRKISATSAALFMNHLALLTVKRDDGAG
jgi:hypothetical protein